MGIVLVVKVSIMRLKFETYFNCGATATLIVLLAVSLVVVICARDPDHAKVNLTSLHLSANGEVAFETGLIELERAVPGVTTVVVESSLVEVRSKVLLDEFPNYRFVSFQTFEKQSRWASLWKPVGFVARSNECWAIDESRGQCWRISLTDAFSGFGTFLKDAGASIQSIEDAARIGSLIEVLFPEKFSRGEIQEVSSKCWRLAHNKEADWETYFEVTLDENKQIVSGRMQSNQKR